ncbi:MAG: cobalamin-dependent protein, partial [Candidatus Aenigmarchaeota archaeon]|nr:cobalamin-dependent protein [Candidatus Aenigmarchaeota archaeon]
LVKPKGRRGLGFAVDLIPIGLEYIAAAIENIVDDVRIIDMELEKKSLQHFIDVFHPDLVGITMSTTEHNEGLHLAKITKENNITTVVGGYHPTLVPETLLSYPQIDMVIRGEGEYTMKELVLKGSPKGVLGVSYKDNGRFVHNKDRPPIQNLDLLSFPARQLRRYKYKDRINNNGREIDVISMSRGCWGRCSFCCEPAMSKSRQRFRSPENVMEELLEIVSFHNGKPLQILATDPHFMGDPKITDRFCDLLYEHRLDVVFSVMARADVIASHPELIKKMCDNGILGYEIGIESPNPRDLQNTRKDITPEIQKKAVKILRDNDANVSGSFVIGLPDQTEEEIKQFPSYAREIGLMNTAYGIATPFPGTEFYEDLKKKGMIAEHDITKYDNMHPIFDTKHITMERLQELAVYCMARFWTIDAFTEHAASSKKRTGNKMNLINFMQEMSKKILFARNAGDDLLNGNSGDTIRAIVEALRDSCNDEPNGKTIHEVVEMSMFLRILGNQTIQYTLKTSSVPQVSYIVKTTKKNIEYVKTIPGKQDNATIDLDMNLDKMINDINDSNGVFQQIKPYIQILMSSKNTMQAVNAMRLFAAVSTEIIASSISQKMNTVKGGLGYESG